MEKRSRKRSRNGCFTCRKRKKKCDESLYPQCRNCNTNELQCTWPEHVVESKTLRQTPEKQKKLQDPPSETPSSSSPPKPEQQVLATTVDPASLTHLLQTQETQQPHNQIRRRLSEPYDLATSKLLETIPAQETLESGVPQISQPVQLAHSGAPQQDEYRISKPKAGILHENRKGKNYFLQRIAMQQDCVEEEEEDEDVYGEGKVNRDLIRSYIARQMDLGDTFPQK